MPQDIPGALAAAGLTQPGSRGLFHGFTAQDRCVLSQSCKCWILVSTRGCSEQPLASGCSSSHGFLTHQDGTSWKGLGKACQSQSPDGIFVLPGNRQGKGSECGWVHGRSVGCAANPALCQRLWYRNSSDSVFLFQFLLPRHRAAPGVPRSLRGHAAQLDKHLRVQDHFSNYFFLRRRRGEKSDFLPSFSVGQLPSLPGAASLRLHRLSPASGQKARPTSSLLHPGAWAGSGFFTFPKAGFSSQLGLGEETELNLGVPASGCCQRGIWGLGTLLAPVSPRLDCQLCSESLRASFHHSCVFPVPGIARSQLQLPFVRGYLCMSVSVHIFSL